MKTTALKIRPMRKRDVASVIRINNATLPLWDREDVSEYLTDSKVVCLVASYARRVAGFVVYEKKTRLFSILALAVDESCQRQGVGKALLNKVKEELSSRYYRDIRLNSTESAMPFYQSQGFVPFKPTGQSKSEHWLIYRLPKTSV